MRKSLPILSLACHRRGTRTRSQCRMSCWQRSPPPSLTSILVSITAPELHLAQKKGVFCRIKTARLESGRGFSLGLLELTFCFARWMALNDLPHPKLLRDAASIDSPFTDGTILRGMTAVPLSAKIILLSNMSIDFYAVAQSYVRRSYPTMGLSSHQSSSNTYAVSKTRRTCSSRRMIPNVMGRWRDLIKSSSSS